MITKLKYYISKLMKKLHMSAVKDSSIHATSKIASASHVINTTMDKYSYIGNNCTVVDTEIGSFCSIADNTIIGGASHPIDWVSTSPIFCHGENIMKKNFSIHFFNPNQATIIKNDVWIGSNTLLKSGITVNTGAVVGMGSVVTKDVGPYEIWAGNPAKLIKKRFDDNTIESLLKSKWWDLDDVKLIENSKDFNDITRFLKEMKRNEKG